MSDDLQNIANRVNLGAHQTVIVAEDEEGRSGRWVVHRPTMRDELKIAVDYAQFKTPEDGLSPVQIDVTYDNLAYMCATLNTVIDMRPDWFPKDAADCFDITLVGTLFEKYCEWKDCFRRRVSGEQGEDRGTPESA